MSDLHPIPRTGHGEPQADVIFVHGLSGHPYETWQHDKRNREDSWPFWLAKEMPEIAVWTLAHDAAWHQWFGQDAMPLTHSALDALGELVRHRIGRVPIGFVCHSLGGLLVKQVLLSAVTLNNPKWQPVAEQTRAIAFVGTPHAGADLATLLFRLGRALGTSPAIEYLRAHDSNLMSLNIWYRQNATRLQIRTLCYFESRKTKIKLLGFLPWGVRVVASGDADPGIADAIPSPLGGDHFAICKPVRRDTRLCHEVAELVREILAKPPGAPGDDAKERPIIVDPLALPADLGDFQERGEKQAKLLAALTRPGQAAAITTLNGMGGIGKTALAVHVAHQLKGRFPDGIRYLDLKGISHELEGAVSNALTPLETMGRVIQSFDEGAKIPEDLDQAGALYRHTLDGKRLLLLLDNARDSDQVRPLLDPKNRGAATIIVTSRQTITADGLTPIQLDQMSPEEGVGFLVEMLGADRASNEELERLMERCGRLPLALRVAGRFLQAHPDWAVKDYVDAVNKVEIELDIEGEKDKNVLAILRLSAQQLAKEDSSLAERWPMLAVFPDSFDRQAAAAMWAMEDHQARTDLSSLVGRSLVLFDTATRRYRLHDLMRDVARLPLEGEDQATVNQRLEEAAMRHAQHYCSVLAAANELYVKGGENVLAGLALYDLEQRNIAAGQDWAAKRIEISDDAARLAAQYTGAAAEVLHVRLAPRARIGWLEAQLNSDRKLHDRRGEGAALGNLGSAYGDLGEPRRVIEYCEQHLAIARETGDRRGEATALGNLGVAYAALGELPRAIEYCEQHLAIARETGDRRGEATALGNLGGVYAALGEPRRAIDYYEQTLAIARETGDRRGEAHALGNLGNAYADLDEPRRAIEHYEQVLAIVREIGDRLREGSTLGNLGSAYADLDEPRRAIEHYEQHLAIAREIGNRLDEGAALYNSALAVNRLGDRDEAIKRMEEALASFEQIESPNTERARAKLTEWRRIR